MKDKDNEKKVIVWILLGVVIICAFFALSRIEKRLVFALDSITFNGKTKFTVGENSDIAYHKVPKGFMTIKFNKEIGGYEWSIGKKQQNLFYYKINGKNYNRYDLNGNSNIEVSNIQKQPFVISGQDIINCVKEYKDQQYFMLRNVISKLNPEQFPDIRENESLKSLIYNNKGKYSIVILDNMTTIDKKGYVYDGKVESTTDCKIQFFIVRNFSTKTAEVDTKNFNIDNINYYAKPEVLLTEWQAGHILLSADAKGNITMNMPKCVMFTSTLDSLNNKSKKTAGLLTLKQNNFAFPINGSVYLPNVSSCINSDLCNFKVENGNIYVLNGNNERERVLSGGGLVPNFPKHKIHLRDYVLNCRIGIIGSSFKWSYFWIPSVVLIFIIICFMVVKGMLKLDGKQFEFIWPIFAIAFCYCIGKTMIALKLSYTYPYFEKMTGIIVVYVSLFLLLIFLLTIIFNRAFLEKQPLFQYGKTLKVKLWIIGCAGLILCICAFAVYLMDRGINSGMISAYGSNKIWSLNPLSWFDSESCINDTHRSIVYVLFLVNIVLLISIVFSKFIYKLYDKINYNFIRWKDESLILSWGKYALLMIGILFVLWVAKSSNFITAFITATLLWGFPKMVATFFKMVATFIPSSKEITKYEKMKLCKLAGAFIFAVGSVFFLATRPDAGYITNSIGVVILIVLFYMLERKDTAKVQETVNKFLSKIYGVLIFFVVAMVVGGIWYLSHHPEKIDYGRMERRFTMSYNFAEYEKAGYRYNDSDAEFVKIMNFYVEDDKNGGEDPLSNELHILHPSVSTGQSPVVLNDMSWPCAFRGPYGWSATWIFFLLLLALFVCVALGTLNRSTWEENICNSIPFKDCMQRRLFAVFLWIGTSLYLYCSYKGLYLPFTGRLNPGFGVDSVGEALESALLLAMMTVVEYKSKE